MLTFSGFVVVPGGMLSRCIFLTTGRINDDRSAEIEGGNAEEESLHMSGSTIIFLEAVGRMTNVLCNLSLRTWSNDAGAREIMGRTTFGGESNPKPNIIHREADMTCKLRYFVETLLHRNIYVIER